MKTLTLNQMIQRILKHYGGEITVDEETVTDLASFMKGQLAPHGVLDVINGVLHASVTGVDLPATFPVHPETGYATDIQALVAASAWLSNHGALTYEWHGPSDPAKFRPTPESGVENPPDTLPMPPFCAVPRCGALLHLQDSPVRIDNEWFCEHHGNPHETGSIPERASDDPTLDRHDSLWQVVKCMQDAIKQMSDNEYCYADDEAGTNISHEEVDVIIKHLTHGNEWSAIQYSDAMDMEEDS